MEKKALNNVDKQKFVGYSQVMINKRLLPSKNYTETIEANKKEVDNPIEKKWAKDMKG